MRLKRHIILGKDRRHVEALRDQWLSENPAVKILRIHSPQHEPANLLTWLGGRDIPRVSITVEYE